MKTSIISIDPKRIRLLEKNAHFMPHEMYQRLVRNVKRDGKLTSVPFCVALGWYEEGDEPERWEDTGEPIYQVLSGNHRVMAAVAADLETIDVMVADEPVDRQARLAIQLSHNSIFGDDDPVLLRQLFNDIEDVDLRAYSGLDDKSLDLLADVTLAPFSDVNLQFQLVSILLLPEEMDAAKRAWDEVREMIKGSKETWLARMADYDALMDTLDVAGTAHNVKNTATQMMLVLQVAQRHLADFAEGYIDESGEPRHNDWVPLSTVFGVSKIPARDAARLRRRVDDMVTAGLVEEKHRWRALLLLAERSLTADG